MKKPANWKAGSAPGIATTCPQQVAREMKEALRAVDRDVEQTGTVSADTIDQVRAALALARSC